jgi:hypothetical protein
VVLNPAAGNRKTSFVLASSDILMITELEITLLLLLTASSVEVLIYLLGI